MKTNPPRGNGSTATRTHGNAYQNALSDGQQLEEEPIAAGRLVVVVGPLRVSVSRRQDGSLGSVERPAPPLKVRRRSPCRTHVPKRRMLSACRRHSRHSKPRCSSLCPWRTHRCLTTDTWRATPDCPWGCRASPRKTQISLDKHAAGRVHAGARSCNIENTQSV